MSSPVPLSENAAVLQVKSRSPFDETAFQQGKAELKAKLLKSSQDIYFQDYVRRIYEELEKAGKIRINTKSLDEVARSPITKRRIQDSDISIRNPESARN